jgi:hypothetical protein
MAVLSTAACEALPVGPAGPAGPVGPVADPQFLCVGVPQAACRQAFSGGFDPARPNVVQVVVRCSGAICTDAQGEAEVTFAFADGQRQLWTYGWESADSP